jgi:hypothetical protein
LIGGTTEDESERTGRVLNAFTVLLSVSLFARGFEFHVWVAAFMAVVVPLLLRITVGLFVYEVRHEAFVEGLDGHPDG